MTGDVMQVPRKSGEKDEICTCESKRVLKSARIMAKNKRVMKMMEAATGNDNKKICAYCRSYVSRMPQLSLQYISMEYKVAIKCKNSADEYESKAVGGVDDTGAFSVPLAADLHSADCIAQLHSSASSAPCPGQEPSKIMPVSEGTTYGVVVAGENTAMPSAVSPECASMTLCGPIKKHIIEHFHHKKPVPPKPEPKPQPHPDYGPVPKPEPKPQPHPDYHPVPSTPTYGGGGGYHGHH
ncbi:proline-rich protein 4-like [Triticum urartu]|uniref:proline-rich protein 4-like n=1 Tax=Triticum urartu TaxID=4572 RepID=UPI002043337F|nr:proline-rich protein 4-like [Triticum urartu]